ncbi:MAG: hypothetical protein U0794_11210 [Isosphaeraceae bacterium]
MSIGTTQPLSLRRVDFHALYDRHLGRHSQFGLNVNHLIALTLIWYGVYETLTQTLRLFGLPPLPFVAVLAGSYLLLVSLNLPSRVIVATAAFLGLFLAGVLATPQCPAWTIPLFLLLIPIGYKFQTWGHRVWTLAADMTEFNRRFPPGRDLNRILMTFEVPVCLYYLLFRRQDWR